MRFAVPPSPADRLAIAVVAEPERSRPLPPGQREDATRLLLQTAGDAGVSLVATRPEGDVERMLGQAWPFPSPFRVTVRTVPLADGLDRVEARARRSLERMGLPRGDAVLVQSAADLAGAEGRALWDRLQALKDRGIFRKIGFVAAVEDGPALMARRFQPDVVQIACNILDQRAARGGAIEEMAAQGVEVHLASVFAQGLLFAHRDSLPPELADHGMALSRTRRRLAEARIDPMQAALAYALNLPGVDQVVASVASAAEMRAMIAASHARTPDIDWSALALDEGPAALASRLRLRISNAA
ncbi:aldo/keto reductase [Brevundimonas faecalis]|uniref:D-threo-aldose 1-dehydrogenase n=1 Tax=Brevundimonas faecalis TaxID=947378 RepID=A0ABV2RCD1_9CAUL